MLSSSSSSSPDKTIIPSPTELSLLSQNFDLLACRLKRERVEETYLKGKIEEITFERDRLAEEIKNLQTSILNNNDKSKDLLELDAIAIKISSLPSIDASSSLQLLLTKEEHEHSMREQLELQNTINEETKFISKIFKDLKESSDRISIKLFSQ